MPTESLNQMPTAVPEEGTESPEQIAGRLSSLFQDPDSVVATLLKEKGMDKLVPERDGPNNFDNPAFLARHEEYKRASQEERRNVFASARETIGTEDEAAQRKLADRMFNEIVGDGEMPKSGRLDTVYGYQQQFAGTEFAKRFQARENTRLRKYGYSAAFPESGFVEEAPSSSEVAPVPAIEAAPRAEAAPASSPEPQEDRSESISAAPSAQDSETEARIHEVRQRLGIASRGPEATPTPPSSAPETGTSGSESDLARIRTALLASENLSNQDWSTVPEGVRDSSEFVRGALLRGAEFGAVASERLKTDPAMLLDALVITGMRVSRGEGSEAAYTAAWNRVPPELQTDTRFTQAATAGMNGRRDYNYLPG
ncbi:MAG: hypothetical protein JWO84_805 [Parcubacteria group bacterium]|nr:hypothetical protein [Parcubacteria group bacterium]